MIIHDDREIIGRGSVGLDNDEIPDLIGRETHVPFGDIVDGDRLARDSIAIGEIPPLVDEFLFFLVGEVTTATGVPGRFSAVALSLALFFEFLFGAVTFIDFVLFFESFDDVVVDVQSLALGVRRVGPSLSRSFVPVQAQPSHGGQDAVHVLLGGAVEVRIFDSKDKLSAAVPRKKPVK
jgi:hypothetical protein